MGVSSEVDTIGAMRTAAILAAGTITLAGCGTSPVSSDDAPSTTEPVVTGLDEPQHAHGFAFSPSTYEPEGWNQFFDVAASGATLVTWAGDWSELSADTGPAVVINGLAAEHGMDTMAVVGPFSEGRAVRPVAGAAESYVEKATAYATAFQPRFLTLGIEIDIAATREPDEFDAFVEVFADAARSVHGASPDTKVLVAFSLESLSGRRDGIIGEGITDPQWELIDRFPDADIIAFTTYPGLIFKDPEDIPDDYYTRLAEIVDKPIGFVEMGWHSGEIGASEWDSTPEEQAKAISVILERMASLDAELVIWSFLWGPPGIVPLDTMGLFDAGSEPASETWENWNAFWGVGSASTGVAVIYDEFRSARRSLHRRTVLLR